MANTTISPNMNLPVPVPSVDPGPDWATNIVACLGATGGGIDSHNHSSGQGVQINPNGININADLPFNNNNGTQYRSVRFTAQGSPLSTASDVGCLYESGVDLYYNDGSGNQVRITQSGSVTGATGTITGLPSGTASASFSGGTFTFQSATNTPATMSFGSVLIGQETSTPKFVTIEASGSQSANYSVTLPISLPSAASNLAIDTSGNLSYQINTSDTFDATVSWVYSSGSTATITGVSQSWYYVRVGNIVTVQGLVTYTVTGVSGTAIYEVIASIPIATAALAPAGFLVDDEPSSSGSVPIHLIMNNSSTVRGFTNSAYTANGTGYVVFSYMYQIS